MASRPVAALVCGSAEFDRRTRLAGMILDRVGPGDGEPRGLGLTAAS
ncbi:hypothetical protein [Parafrankia discariae]|nr:hypothetical protein [Parafrankia discariae]